LGPDVTRKKKARRRAGAMERVVCSKQAVKSDSLVGRQKGE
jgi:hypothetical protein